MFHPIREGMHFVSLKLGTRFTFFDVKFFGLRLITYIEVSTR